MKVIIKTIKKILPKIITIYNFWNLNKITNLEKVTVK